MEREKILSYRRMREAANEKLRTSSAKGFYDMQMKEAVLQACNLVDERGRHFRRAAASMTLSTVYGFPKLVYEFAERIFKVVYMGAHSVEFLPWLRHFPSR
jgi:hypothetical protein